MATELKIPELGESITEAQIGRWLKHAGDDVEKDEPIAELETDKVTVELPAPIAGRISELTAKEGDSANVGDVIGYIETDGEATKEKPRKAQERKAEKKEKEPKVKKEAKKPEKENRQEKGKREAETEEETKEKAEAPEPQGPPKKGSKEAEAEREEEAQAAPEAKPRREARKPSDAEREEEAVPMSPMRRRIAQRLVEAQQTAALLTTVNEVDMSTVIDLRNRYRDRFREKYDIKLGFMSFFVKAAVDALKRFPQVNAIVRDDDIVYRNYFDIGIAVATERGLVAPIVRDADRLSFAQIEKTIDDFARRARENRITLDELQGGTFTITNGGVFGSLLSTPIVNPPQSGVLGMHAIQQRPIATDDGRIEARPMMYIALTYDHRIVDGREAVLFLKRIKEAVESPVAMMLEL